VRSHPDQYSPIACPMNRLPVTITLTDGFEAQLIFCQTHAGGDWTCQTTTEFVFDLQTLLEGHNITATVQ
jgi:hypothetical protein